MAKFILILAPGPFWSSQRALSSHHPLLHDMDISFETLLAKSENHPGILVVLLVLTKLANDGSQGRVRKVDVEGQDLRICTVSR